MSIKTMESSDILINIIKNLPPDGGGPPDDLIREWIRFASGALEKQESRISILEQRVLELEEKLNEVPRN